MTWGVIAWQLSIMWQQIETAPVDRDLELAVMDEEGQHALVFACRRRLDGGWIDAATQLH